MIHFRDWNANLGDYLQTPSDLHAFLADARVLHERGDIDVLDAAVPLDRISPDRPWPDDILSWTFRCRETGRVFDLSVDTYHGTLTWKQRGINEQDRGTITMFRWFQRKQAAPVKPLPTRVTWDQESVSIFAGDPLIESFRWVDMEAVHAFKQDCFGVDRIWITFAIAGREDLASVHEEVDGYKELIAELERRCAGYRPDWWNAVAFPAFETNHTLIWQRGASRPSIENRAEQLAERLRCPDGWRLVDQAVREALSKALRNEVAAGHPLFGVVCTPVMRCQRCDDVLFVCDMAQTPLALVHLTYSGHPEAPPLPSTVLLKNADEWNAKGDFVC